MGGELKNSFCLLRDGSAILSHHIGDLANSRTLADYTDAIARYMVLFEHHAELIAIDLHPEYLSSKLGIDRARRGGNILVEVQHHHAHIAACMAENGVAPDVPVIGVALDGLGFGDDGTLWGGEFLLADYRHFQRLARFKPVAMPGGARAIMEPWRNLYAHIAAAMGWDEFRARYGNTALFAFLAGKPIAVLDRMIARGVNAPLASSCGRLFDAVAAATGICREHAQYEGQAAVEFEAKCAADVVEPYRFALLGDGGVLMLEPRPMWRALLRDIAAGTSVPVLSARFHAGSGDGDRRDGADAPAASFRKPARRIVSPYPGVFSRTVFCWRR